MFIELPFDIHECICQKLNVEDRIKLNITILRKNIKLKKYDNDNKLRIINKAIQKKYIKKITPSIREFIGSYDINDPTIRDLIEQFPELENKKRLSTTTFLEKINKNIITEEDIDCDISVYNIQDIKRAIAFCKLSTFKIIIKNIQIKEKLEKNRSEFLFDIINYSNIEILEYLVGTDTTLYNIDLTNTVPIFEEYMASILLTKYSSCQLLLKHIVLSQLTLKNSYIKALESMNIECAIYIEKYILEMNL